MGWANLLLSNIQIVVTLLATMVLILAAIIVIGCRKLSGTGTQNYCAFSSAMRWRKIQILHLLGFDMCLLLTSYCVITQYLRHETEVWVVYYNRSENIITEHSHWYKNTLKMQIQNCWEQVLPSQMAADGFVLKQQQLVSYRIFRNCWDWDNFWSWNMALLLPLHDKLMQTLWII